MSKKSESVSANKGNEIKLQTNPLMPYIELIERTRKKQEKLKEQATLDFQKWLDSEHKKTDLSGAMPWCFFCKWRANDVDCTCDSTIRTNEAICVDAYHKMQEKLGK